MTDKSKFEEWKEKRGVWPRVFDEESFNSGRVSLLSDLQSEGMVGETAAAIWSAYGSVPFSKVDIRCRAKFISLAQAALDAVIKKIKGE